jgi:hypothetical protein
MGEYNVQGRGGDFLVIRIKIVYYMNSATIGSCRILEPWTAKTRCWANTAFCIEN